MGGSSNKNTSDTTVQNDVEVNTYTNVDIDLVPLGEILADSQKSASKTDKETAAINLLNAELQRKQTSKNMEIFDEYLENGKNLIILSAITASLLYVYKKNKKGKR